MPSRRRGVTGRGCADNWGAHGFCKKSPAFDSHRFEETTADPRHHIGNEVHGDFVTTSIYRNATSGDRRHFHVVGIGLKVVRRPDIDNNGLPRHAQKSARRRTREDFFRMLRSYIQCERPSLRGFLNQSVFRTLDIKSNLVLVRQTDTYECLFSSVQLQYTWPNSWSCFIATAIEAFNVVCPECKTFLDILIQARTSNLVLQKPGALLNLSALSPGSKHVAAVAAWTRA